VAGEGLARAIGAIREASGRFVGVVERREADGLHAVVPSTPAWTLRDLAHHLGEVQRVWTENVRAADPAAPWGGEVAMPGDDVLAGWLGDGTTLLCDALEAAGPGAPCWTWWGEPATAGAVARHEAQESAVHTWDAEAVGATPNALTPEVADDGVGEFLEIVLGSGAAAVPGSVTLRAIDTGGSWEVTGRGRRRAEVKGTASDLVLMLYRRIPVADCVVEGDPLLVAAFLSLADTS
jgi:uncharacterized protein (TIGR03083 family)